MVGSPAGTVVTSRSLERVACDGEASERTYRTTLLEGKNHQVKCMVHAVSKGANRVVGLHRESIGHLELDPKLAPGEWRHLTREEVSGFGECVSLA